VQTELKLERSTREPTLATLSHCATGLRRDTKDLRTLTLIKTLGVVYSPRRHVVRDGGLEIGAMRHVGRAKQLAAASALLLVLGACSAESDKPGNDPTATPTTTSPSTRATETPPSPSEVASQAAKAKVREYYSVRDRLRTDPAVPLRLLRSVAISVELDAQHRLFKNERRQGIVQTGQTRIAELTVQSVDLDNSDPKAGRVPTVQVDVCYDVSDVDIIDADGKSIVKPDRPETGWIRYFVSNYQWASDPNGAWRVASSKSLERTSCDAS
jgi:hypothetical protein